MDLRTIAHELLKMRGVDPDTPSQVIEAPWLDIEIPADEIDPKPAVVKRPRVSNEPVPQRACQKRELSKDSQSGSYTVAMKDQIYEVGQKVEDLLKDPATPNEVKLKGFTEVLYEEWKKAFAVTNPSEDTSIYSERSINKIYTTVCKLKNTIKVEDPINFLEIREIQKDGRTVFECPYCLTYNSTTRATVATHTNAAHEGMRWYQCPEKKCDYATLYYYSTQRHAANMHSNSNNPILVENPDRINELRRTKFLTDKKGDPPPATSQEAKSDSQPDSDNQEKVQKSPSKNAASVAKPREKLKPSKDKKRPVRRKESTESSDYSAGSESASEEISENDDSGSDYEEEKPKKRRTQSSGKGTSISTTQVPNTNKIKKTS